MSNAQSVRGLVCPKTRHPVVVTADRVVSTDPETRLAYPIRDDIPIMLADEAEVLSREDWQAVMDAADTRPAENSDDA